MKNAAYDYKSADDNIQYMNKCGANHHLVTLKRIRNYTQGLKFGCKDHRYLQRFTPTIKEQPLK